MLALGFTRNQIAERIAAARLIRIHQGVYAVGHTALSDRGRMIAALLAAGDGAAISHRTAAYVWKLLPSMPQFVELTLTDRRPRPRRGVVVHKMITLATTRHEGLRVTTPLQTLAQLKGTEADRARAEALVLGLVPRTADDHVEPTRSELERRLLPVLEAAGLPRPLVNHRIGRYVADFFWPHHKVVVETDGWAAHGNRRAFERDRARDAVLQAAGHVVLRFTWRQVMDTSLLVTVQVATVLARVDSRVARSS